MSKINRKKIGLALGSGGARGLAHIGVIKALASQNIPINFISGSSAGALIGGLYAYFGKIEPVENLANELNWKDFIKIFSDPSPGSGLFKGEKAISYIQKITNNAQIENLKVPFRAVATDLITGNPIIFDHGDLATAIRASSSVPLVFKPLKLENQLLIDGGASMPIPVEVVKKMGANLTIAVNLYAFEFEKQEKLFKQPAIKDILRCSLNTTLHWLSVENAKDADFIINPKVPITGFMMSEFLNGQKLIDIGVKAGQKEIDKIKELLV